MKSLFKKLTITFKLAITFCFLSLLIAKAAFAEPNILGTWEGKWDGTVTKDGLSLQDLSIRVTNQQPYNPEAESDCRYISGDMDLDSRTGKLYGDVTGFYCPGPNPNPPYKQGTFAFLLRRIENTETREGDREPIQVYQGEIDGETMNGTLLFMSGDFGEYEFYADKKP